MLEGLAAARSLKRVEPHAFPKGCSGTQRMLLQKFIDHDNESFVKLSPQRTISPPGPHEIGR